MANAQWACDVKGTLYGFPLCKLHKKARVLMYEGPLSLIYIYCVVNIFSLIEHDCDW